MRHRKDSNQTEVVQGLRDRGISVAITSNVGSGFPDLVLGYKGFNYLCELKDGKKPPSKRKLTPAEQDFKCDWTGNYFVANNLHEILYLIGWKKDD